MVRGKVRESTRSLGIMARYATFMVLCLLALLSTSCFDLHEEWWLQANGSGRAKLEGTVSTLLIEAQGGEPALSQKITRYLGEIPTIQHSRVEFRTHERETTITVEVKFDSIRELISPPAVHVAHGDRRLLQNLRSIAGTMDFKLTGRRVALQRTVSLRRALPGANWIPQAKLKNRKVSYRLHLPRPAAASNATRSEDSGRTLVWEYSLAHALAQPVSTRFEVLLPIPRWLIGSLILAALVGFFIVFCCLRGKKTSSRGA